MAKTKLTLEEKIAKAKEAVKTLKTAGGEGEGAGVALREAKKLLKRAERRSKLLKADQAKKAKMEENRQKNIEKAQEKIAKKKSAEEAALNAAAEKQAQEQMAAEGAQA